MAEIKDLSQSFIVMGLDPGSENLGVGLLEVDFETYEVLDAQAFTLVGTKSHYFLDYDVRLYNERFARIRALGKMLDDVLKCYQPAAVACESPFYNPVGPMPTGCWWKSYRW